MYKLASMAKGQFHVQWLPALAGSVFFSPPWHVYFDDGGDAFFVLLLCWSTIYGDLMFRNLFCAFNFAWFACHPERFGFCLWGWTVSSFCLLQRM